MYYVILCPHFTQPRYAQYSNMYIHMDLKHLHIYIYILFTHYEKILLIHNLAYIHTYIDMHIVYIVYISIGYLGTGARFSFLKPRSSQMLPAASKMLSGPGVDKMPWRSHHVDITWMCWLHGKRGFEPTITNHNMNRMGVYIYIYEGFHKWEYGDTVPP